MSEFFIYLVEQPGAALDAVQRYCGDLDSEKQKWLEWAKSSGLPCDVKPGIDREGYCYGFIFPSGLIPAGWRRPDKNGCSFPRAKNPIRKTMPKQIRLENEKVYAKQYGLDIPTRITISRDGKESRSWGIGHWFNPVQFGWFGDCTIEQCCIVTPNYEDDLGKAALKLQDGETMQPAPDFDWRNLLSGCRLIKGYEWDYLRNKYKVEH